MVTYIPLASDPDTPKEELILTLGVTGVVVAMVITFEVAGLPVAQVAFEVTMHDTWSPLFNAVVGAYTKRGTPAVLLVTGVLFTSHW